MFGFECPWDISLIREVTDAVDAEKDIFPAIRTPIRSVCWQVSLRSWIANRLDLLKNHRELIEYQRFPSIALRHFHRLG